jgi:hypothetical protein
MAERPIRQRLGGARSPLPAPCDHSATYAQRVMLSQVTALAGLYFDI